MERRKLLVPKGIRFISDWKDYDLRQYDFPHILNKQITGCGFTEYCLTNDMNIILCSPRRILLENKEGKHKGEVFYFRNEFEELQADFEKDLMSNKPTRRGISSKKKVIDENAMYLKMCRLKGELLSYIEQRCEKRLPIKILVTYDSFRLVREFIECDLKAYRMDDFYVVIDEFQSVTIDSRFKSSTEINFMSQLGGLRKVCFASATPMLDPYLEMLDEFKDLPYFEMDWGAEDPSRIVKPFLEVHSTKSIVASARGVIDSYMEGNFAKYSFKDPAGRICEIESREAVLYFNSVKNICDIIKKCNLTPENTNVLCSKTERNIKLVRRAFRTSCGRKGGIGVVPGLNEPHKMFTLCTRTVYLGADFYSTCARSFIFSDANIDCLAVDISLDLPQILGRQRLETNPWKNNATLFFRHLADFNSLSPEVFDKILERKTRETYLIIEGIEDMKEVYKNTFLDRLETAVKLKNYEKDYFSVNYDETGEPYPVFNNLVKVAEMRAFDVQQVDYKDRFAVFNAISQSGNSIEFSEVDRLLIEFDGLNQYPEKMKFICDHLPYLPEQLAFQFLSRVPVSFGNYYNTLGPERCASFGYRHYALKSEYDRLVSNQSTQLTNKIYDSFLVGEKYSLSQIKQTLSDIYGEIGYIESPKATLLKDYFDVRPLKFTVKDEEGNSYKVHGYELLSKKGEEWL